MKDTLVSKHYPDAILRSFVFPLILISRTNRSSKAVNKVGIYLYLFHVTFAHLIHMTCKFILPNIWESILYLYGIFFFVDSYCSCYWCHKHTNKQTDKQTQDYLTFVANTIYLISVLLFWCYLCCLYLKVIRNASFSHLFFTFRAHIFPYVQMEDILPFPRWCTLFGVRKWRAKMSKELMSLQCYQIQRAFQEDFLFVIKPQSGCLSIYTHLFFYDIFQFHLFSLIISNLTLHHWSWFAQLLIFDVWLIYTIFNIWICLMYPFFLNCILNLLFWI